MIIKRKNVITLCTGVLLIALFGFNVQASPVEEPEVINDEMTIENMETPDVNHFVTEINEETLNSIELLSMTLLPQNQYLYVPIKAEKMELPGNYVTMLANNKTPFLFYLTDTDGCTIAVEKIENIHQSDTEKIYIGFELLRGTDTIQLQFKENNVTLDNPVNIKLTTEYGSNICDIYHGQNLATSIVVPVDGVVDLNLTQFETITLKFKQPIQPDIETTETNGSEKIAISENENESKPVEKTENLFMIENKGMIIISVSVVACIVIVIVAFSFIAKRKRSRK